MTSSTRTRISALACALVMVGAACGGGDAGAGNPQAGVEAAQSDGAASVRLAPLPKPERTEVVGAFWDGKVAVMGGLLLDGGASPQVDFYDPGTDTWSPGPALPLGLHHAGAGVMDGRLYVVGGYAGSPWAPVADVFSLGPGESAWRAEPKLSGPRGALAVASLPGGALVAMGGVGSGDLVRTEILESGASGWRPGPELSVQREHLAATATRTRAWAIAGRVGTLESNRDSVESIALDEGEWRAEPKLNHTRGGIGGATIRGHPCVAGGEEPGGGTIAPIECLVEDRWRVVAHLEVPRHGVAVVANGNRLHVIGGGPKAGLYVSDVHEAFDL